MRGRALAGVLLAACLPEGGPGVGEQRLAERGLADVVITGGEAPAGLLFTRPSAALGEDQRPLRDLFFLPEGGAERALATALPAGVRGALLWDARGRPYLQRDPGVVGTRGTAEVVRLDLATGEPRALGRVRALRLSPSRRLVYLETPEGAGRLRTMDDDERSAGADVREARFVGEDLWVLDGTRLLVAPGDGAPVEEVARGLSTFRALPGGRGDLLALGVEADGATDVIHLRRGEPARVLARAALVGGTVFVAPDRRRLAFGELGGGSVTVRLIDLEGGMSVVSVPVAPGGRPPGLEVAFRPGSDELWIFVNQALHVARAGGWRRIEGAVHTFARIGPGRDADRLALEAGRRSRTPRGSLFTADGARWIFRGRDGLLRLGDAHDPGSEDGIVVSGPGGSGNVVELGPGRLAVWLEPGDDRQDLHLLDLADGRLRFLARDVGATAFGSRRVVAIARKVGDRRATGDLVTVDLADGAESLLARNVSELALAAACAGCEATAPGAALVYVVQARVPWRHEGLWAASLP